MSFEFKKKVPNFNIAYIAYHIHRLVLWGLEYSLAAEVELQDLQERETHVVVKRIVPSNSVLKISVHATFVGLINLTNLSLSPSLKIYSYSTVVFFIFMNINYNLNKK